jgi:glycine cleavage system H lipoate-binding protein
MGDIRMEQQASNSPSACLWVQAGVIRRKYCRLKYDCRTCRFDKALRRVCDENPKAGNGRAVSGLKRNALVHWKERLKELPQHKQPCIHHMKGEIEFRCCTNAYSCSNCEFDQFFQDDYSVHAVVKPVDVLNIDGVRIPQGFYLHPGHMWARIEAGDSVRIGLDDFALRIFGPFDRILAPLMGKTVHQGRADIAVHRGSHSAVVMSPVSGVVTAVNAALRDQAGTVGQDPYAAGWVLRLHAVDLRKEMKALMISTETGVFLRGEIERLHDLIEDVSGPLAADGGHIGEDIYGKMPDLGWDRLERMFLNQ